MRENQFAFRRVVLYHEAVRRISASSLLVALFYSLIAPALFADPESNLPECCRRKGAHQCSMSTPDESSIGSLAFKLGQRCPAFPQAPAVTSDGAAAFSTSPSAIFAALVSHPAVQQQTEARYRVSFSRSRQKRGPPAFLS